LRIEPARQENLDFASQVLRARSARGLLRVHPRAAAEEARRNDARVVQNKELVAAEEIWQICKKTVLEASSGTGQDEHTRGIATLQGLLRNLSRGQIVVEIIEAHAAEV